MCTVPRHTRTYHVRGSYNYYTVVNREKLLLTLSELSECRKGICLVWPRGRHFSPLLPGYRYLKFNSQKCSRGRDIRENRLVRRSGATSTDTALLVFCSRMRRSLKLKFSPYSWEKISANGQVITTRSLSLSLPRGSPLTIKIAWR